LEQGPPSGGPTRETLLRLQPEILQIEAGKLAGGNTGPSCEIFKACTIAGWDCTWGDC